MSGVAVTDVARSLDPAAVGVLGAVAAFLVVLAVAAQRSVRVLQQELETAAEELVDPHTGLLPRAAVRVRLGAELAWSAASHTPVAVAVLRIRGSRFRHAAQVLRHSMREEEGAFLLGDQHVAVELWAAGPDAALAATRRLGDQLADAGHPVVDAGIACSPRDGTDVETLLETARRDLRPIDDPLPPGRTVDEDGSAPGWFRHTLAMALSTVPPFVAFAMLLLLCWRLVPAAVEPALAAGSRSARDVLHAFVALVGIPAGAALLHLAFWNASGVAPRSRPRCSGGRRTAAVIAALVVLPLAWAVLAPGWPDALSEGTGVTLAVLALVVLALLHARRLVHLPVLVVGAIGVAGAATTAFAVEVEQMPVLANAGRLAAAAALGAMLARLVERASWIAFLAVMAALVDIWSVYARGGVTNRLLESGDAPAGRVVDLLLFTGPSVEGAPQFAVGITDLVFLALFLCWAHDWRLDMRVVALALLAGTWLGLATGELLDSLVPLLPFLALAMLLVVATRSVTLRTRVAAWRRALAEAPGAGDGG